MIHFDELSVAEKIYKTQSFVYGYNRTYLTIYAKYIRYKKIIDDGLDYNSISVDYMISIDKYTEKKLISFCDEHYKDFNYNIDYGNIDAAVKYSQVSKLKLPLPTPITKKEWDTISLINNDNYRRMLFVMLVDAKYYRYHNCMIGREIELTEDTKFYCQMKKSEIYKAGKTKFSCKEEKDMALGCFYDNGLFDITDNQFSSWLIKFVDISDDNIIDYITDYEHLNLHYEKLIGENVSACKLCGCLFKQNKKNNAIYCYKHRGYNKKINSESSITKICKNCNKEFVISSRGKRDICDSCYSKHRSLIMHYKKGLIF